MGEQATKWARDGRTAIAMLLDEVDVALTRAAALRAEVEKFAALHVEFKPPPLLPERLDEAALEAISPVVDDDEVEGKIWPGGALGALCDGFLELASEFGHHNGGADALVWAARAEARLMAAEIRSLRKQLSVMTTAAAGMALALPDVIDEANGNVLRGSALAGKRVDAAYSALTAYEKVVGR